MKRAKHRIKQEAPERRGAAGGSAAPAPAPEERELAYYIHDRVELMHQVFSVLKGRELRAMTPASVLDLNVDDLQELCLEELLGISSKRLCAVLDGAEPPSDTSSSESELLETVSLDSISSVEQLSDEPEKPEKRKRRCKRKEAKAAAAGGAQAQARAGADPRAAERAGMTVLELLELQARARAIRAQLSLEKTKKAAEGAAPAEEAEEVLSDGGSVEIKEEAAEVVELVSSDEEDRKPPPELTPTEVTPAASQSTITKKNDLTIIVPSTQTHRKVKLNRTKVSVVVVNAQDNASTKEMPIASSSKTSDPKGTPEKSTKNTDKKSTEEVNKAVISTKSNSNIANVRTTKPSEKNSTEKVKTVVKGKKRISKKRSKKEDRDGIDHDEIMLQLSDSEKMDLLEDFDRKHYDSVSSSDSEESSSESDSEIDAPQRKQAKDTEKGKSTIKDKTVSTTTPTGSDGQKASDIAKSSECPISDITDVEKGKQNTGTSNKEIESKNDEVQVEVVPIEPGQKKINYVKSIESGLIELVQEKSSEVKSIESEPISSGGEESSAMKSTGSEPTESGLKEINEASTDSGPVDSGHGDRNYFENTPVQEPVNVEDKLADNTPVHSEVVKERDVETCNSEHITNILQESEIVISCIDDIPLLPEGPEPECNIETNNTKTEIVGVNKSNETPEKDDKNYRDNTKSTEENVDGHNNGKEINQNLETSSKSQVKSNTTSSPKTAMDKEMSEGEVSDRSSSEVEVFEKSSEVVCISDDDDIPKSKAKKKKDKTKKKKEKKAKKEKKSKKDKKSDFREAGDQNFFNKSDSSDEDSFQQASALPKKLISLKSLSTDSKYSTSADIDVSSPDHDSSRMDADSDNLFQICEISDDSSCYEVEGVSILSKEPTSEEIEALSTKIDTEIEREDVVTEEQIQRHENKKSEINTNSLEAETGNLEDISWKDRWLGSSKVKKVMKTSNILNAMRKKNKELKKKLAESKRKSEPIVEETIKPEIKKTIEEGTIEHFNMLTGSTQFVDPVKEPKAPEELLAAVKDAIGLCATKDGDTDENKDTRIIDKKDVKEQTNSDNAEQTKVTVIESNTGENVENKDKNSLIANGGSMIEKDKSDLDKDLKKDAKQLLKMYKRLLKYNNMNKVSDPNKPKKKKSKKQKKNKEKSAPTIV